jgi:hypothetical protein
MHLPLDDAVTEAPSRSLQFNVKIEKELPDNSDLDGWMILSVKNAQEISSLYLYRNGDELHWFVQYCERCIPHDCIVYVSYGAESRQTILESLQQEISENSATVLFADEPSEKEEFSYHVIPFRFCTTTAHSDEKNNNNM